MCLLYSLSTHSVDIYFSNLYNLVLQEEERKKREMADRQIEQMEAEEMRLIERLRATQEAQRNAYEQLELALAEEVVSSVEKK